MFKGLRDKALCDARGEASGEPPRPARWFGDARSSC